MGSLLDQLVTAIEECGQTRYQIAKGSGVDQAVLSRLVRGEMGMSVANIERIADYLELEIVLRPKRRHTRKKR